MRNFLSFSIDRAVLLNIDSGEIESQFKDRMESNPRYQWKEGLAYIGFIFHGTAPLTNKKGMGITFATQRNSIHTAIDQLIDVEHQAEDLPVGATKTNVVGHICDLWFANTEVKDWLIQDIIPKEPSLVLGIMSLYERKAEVAEIIRDIQSGEKWYFSLESDPNTSSEPEIWLSGATTNNIVTFSESPEALRNIADKLGQDNPEMYYNGQRVSYLIGGGNGNLSYIGGAITRYPAGLEQQPNVSLKYLCNIDASITPDLYIAKWHDIKEVPGQVKIMNGVALTLEQCNKLAEVADAITKDDPNTNGWAIAKAQFKKGHIIKNGSWVSKADTASEFIFAVWDTAYIHELPDSSFAVIEGDYKTGKTDNKNCRHLPFKDKSGKIDLPQLRNALDVANHIAAISENESDDELRSKAMTVLEHYRDSLKEGKEEAGLEINEIILEDFEDVVQFMGLLKFEEVDRKMPRTFTDEEYETEKAKIKKEAEDELIASGKWLASEVLAGYVKKEDADKMVSDSIVKTKREAMIASLGLDAEKTEDFKVLAGSEKYPYTPEGDTSYEAMIKRWKDQFTASLPDKDKHTAGLEGDKGKEFSPNSGAGGTDEYKFNDERITNR
jgi:hypothetical protein